jgi:hypothetical protein
MDAATVDRDALDEHAARQLGLFTRAQARTCGFTLSQITRRRREGDWVEVRRHVLADRGVALTPQVRDLAVQLSVPDAVLTGPSAARWHGIVLTDTGTCVALDPARHSRPRGVTVFREPVPEEDIEQVGPVRITVFDRAVFDCLRALPDRDALALFDQVLEGGRTTLTRIADRVGAFTNRRGAPRLVGLLRKAAMGSHSASKQLAIRLLQRAGIWGWVADEPIADAWGLVCIGDVVFARQRLLIELDGSPAEAGSQRDRRLTERHSRLQVAGWTVLTASWHDLSARPDDVVAVIRLTLDRLKVTDAGPHPPRPGSRAATTRHPGRVTTPPAGR